MDVPRLGARYPMNVGIGLKSRGKAGTNLEISHFSFTLNENLPHFGMDRIHLFFVQYNHLFTWLQSSLASLAMSELQSESVDLNDDDKYRNPLPSIDQKAKQAYKLENK